MRGLQDKSGIVAGGARGIGVATAMRLAAEGARVVIGDIRAELAEDMAARIRADGGKALGLALDITDPQSVQAARRPLSPNC